MIAVAACSVSRRRGAVGPRTDPKAAVESAGGQTIRVNRDKEEVRIEYESCCTYADGADEAARGQGRRPSGPAAGRSSSPATRRGRTERDRTIVLDGRRAARRVSDGLERDAPSRRPIPKPTACVRAPGAVEFSRGRMPGRASGLTYDKNRDVLTILDEAVVRVAPDEQGAGALDIIAGIGRVQPAGACHPLRAAA